MPKKISNKTISSVQKDALLKILENRFLKNMHRHKEIEWEKVKAKLQSQQDKLWSLNEMEASEGEPDVIGFDI